MHDLRRTGYSKRRRDFRGSKENSGKIQKREASIVDEDFNLKGLITIKDIEKQIKYPLSAKDEQGRLLCGAAVGITANVMARVDALVNARVDVIVVDSAHGHSANILKAVREIKAKYPDLQLIAGNVATGEATRALIEAGVDAVEGNQLVLSVQPVWLQVSVYRRLQQLWIVMQLQKNMEFRLSQTVESSIPEI